MFLFILVCLVILTSVYSLWTAKDDDGYQPTFPEEWDKYLEEDEKE